MSARDRKAVDYAKERLADVMRVLAEMETHAPVSTRRYARKLRAALALPDDMRLKCECLDCTVNTTL